MAEQLPLGDAIPAASRAALPPPPALPGHDSEKPSAVTGRVTSGAGGATLAAPLVGCHPGLTRIALDPE